MSPLLEERIGEWRAWLGRRHALPPGELQELEKRLRDQVGALREAGLDDDEAFLVAVKRLGDLGGRELARDYSERLWKQLVAPPRADRDWPGPGRDAVVAVGLAVAAAVSVKVPELLGRPLNSPGDVYLPFYSRNISLLVLPLLAVYFVWKRRLEAARLPWAALPFVAGALIVNLLPFEPGGHTEGLAALHLPIALWLGVGFAYAGGAWRDRAHRMDFLRFSGEWFIYYTLIALGGGVLTAFTGFVFHAIGMDVGRLLGSWVLPCGAAGAVLIAAALVEAKQSVIENMAPVLTRLFSPLFVLMLLCFLATMLWTGSAIDVEREVLIGFDLLLALVLGLVLYAISARDPGAPPGAFDVLQLLLVAAALAVDALALWAIAARISSFGFSPNRVAALGENVILLANLAGAAWLNFRFLRGRAPFGALERWQTSYLPVYAIWAWLVVALFPVAFAYR